MSVFNQVFLVYFNLALLSVSLGVQEKSQLAESFAICPLNTLSSDTCNACKVVVKDISVHQSSVFISPFAEKVRRLLLDKTPFVRCVLLQEDDCKKKVTIGEG